MRITVISGARRCGVDCADGECRVRVSGGRYGVRGREVLACRTPAEEGLCVRVGQYRGGGLTEGLSAPFACDGEEGVGLAVDIGTTTVAFVLCDLADGKILEKYACLNSQSGFGADVITLPCRCAACILPRRRRAARAPCGMRSAGRSARRSACCAKNTGCIR